MDRLDKKSILSIPYDDEGLCCAKAIVYALAHLNKDTTAINAMKNCRRPALVKRAKELHMAANVPLGPCTFSEIAIFEDHLDVQIAVFSSENLNRVVYKGRERTQRINLWLHDAHYDVIKSLKGFFGSNHYCTACEKPHDHPESHRCANACPICLRTDCFPGQPQRCQDCDRLCRSDVCYTAHKALTGNQDFSLCDRVYHCRDCCQVIRRRDCPKELHKCGTTKCPSCSQFVVAAEHRCYLRRVAPKKSDDNFIFFDFETDQSSGEHLVNFAVAQYADGTEKVFPGYAACQDFCAWLFSTEHKGFTAMAHNMKGFDGQFVMAWLLEQGTAPEVIPNGSMIMNVRHPSLNIRVIDSLNFLPMALAKLPGCFGLTELKKGYFPSSL
ncbi:uncharacterized protein LOC118190704 [Stegodyphus dumicola]|uniref:uncharacterized protein LOC118190704 n=1 Tax=Stegodyphus dumicola TaxID=202533 RepID=UPI0015A9E7C2|nr:uncharacterized protein LOC118190704 [Stegodyphus dumicola]